MSRLNMVKLSSLSDFFKKAGKSEEEVYLYLASEGSDPHRRGFISGGEFVDIDGGEVFPFGEILRFQLILSICAKDFYWAKEGHDWSATGVTTHAF